MRNLIRPTDSPAIVPLITRNQITRISFITGIADATPDQVRVPQVIRHAILARAMRRSVHLIAVERPRRFPHRRTQTVPRALRLLAELVEGPPVRTTRGALELLAGEAFEQRVTNTVTCCSITVSSIGTFEGRMGLIGGAGHVGPRCGGDA